VPIKVLIVDDNLMFRKLITRYLQKNAGVIVVGEAHDGDEAVSQAEELKPDIVLLDVDMPNQGGPMACVAIKKSMPEIRVYYCSAHSDTLLSQLAKGTIADGVVRKSMLKEDLARIVAEEERHGEIPGTIRGK
jgi:DNA-binding NarL/FixJ family response regulator